MYPIFNKASIETDALIIHILNILCVFLYEYKIVLV